MKRYTIGIDPDSDKYGIAVYYGEDLKDLLNLNIFQFTGFLESLIFSETLFVIEDVKSNTFVYTRNAKAFKGKTHKQQVNIAYKMGQGLGMCMLSQTVAEMFLGARGCKLIHQRPTKCNWADNKSRFENVTGWTGRSNKDTRSAAFMAYLHINTPLYDKRAKTLPRP